MHELPMDLFQIPLDQKLDLIESFLNSISSVPQASSFQHVELFELR